MAILVEDILALACLLLQPTWPLLALASLATTVALTSSEKLPERTGGVVFAVLLGPLLTSAYRKNAMLHAGDAAHSILWVLASAQALGNLLVHSTVFLIASTALAWAAGLSLWPSIVFLVVQQSCQRCRSFRSYAHCFSFAEVMFWSQSSAFLAALTTQGFRDGYDSWRPTCAFWTVLATCGLIFMLFTACFDALAAHGFAPLLAAAATALLFLLWGLSEQLSDGAIWWFLGYLSQMENLWFALPVALAFNCRCGKYRDALKETSS